MSIDPHNNLLYAAQYSNGNISSMMWSGKDTTIFTKGLSFVYDGANRLKTSTGLGGYADTESGITYDLNGNIKTLTRAGAAVDMLTYSYAGTGNRLGSVTDASPGNKGVKSGTSSYGYDANGNMTSDGNRGAILTYNYLNLPKTVGVGGKTLTYDYDAGGIKHKYVADTLTVKYAGVFEYDANNILKRVATLEGQLVPSGDTLRFDYSLKDHLGNVRVVFDEKGNILQKSDYYPFGLEIDRNSPVQTLADRNAINRYNFLGKETQVATGYIDLSRRFFDPLTGRFTSIDPVTEGQEELSTYQYGWNNPIRFKDPDGMWPWDGLVASFKKWYNTPLTKDQQQISRAASISNSAAKTQGENLENSIILGMSHAVSGVQPGSFRRPANMYKPGVKPGRNSVPTPYGPGKQSNSTAALSALEKVNSGANLYKFGTTGTSVATGSQFWSLENPMINTPQYAQKYGIPLQNIESADFLMIGTVKSNEGFITREAPTAPGAPKNSGGSIEVVTNPDAVKINTFHYLPKQD